MLELPDLSGSEICILVVMHGALAPDWALERADSLIARASHFVRGCGIAPRIALISREVQPVGGRLLK